MSAQLNLMPKGLSETLIASLLLIAITNCTNLSEDGKNAIHRTRAKEYIEKKQYREALIELKNVVQDTPADAEIYYQIALLSLKFDEPGALEDAYNALHKTISLDPSRKDAQLKLAAIYLLGQKTEEARYRAEAILKSNPADADGLSLRAHSYLREGNIIRGLKDLKKVIELDKTNVRHYIDLARAYVQTRLFVEAERTLDQARVIAPNSMDVLLSSADYFFLTGQHASAEENYKKAVAQLPSDATLYAKLAEFYQATRRWSDAEAALERVTLLEPNSAKAYILLGEVHVATGAHERAIEAFQRATSMDPTSIFARNRLIAEYLDHGRISDAEKMVVAILEKNKNDVDGRFFNALLYISRGQIDLAQEILRKVIADRPWFGPAHLYLGLIYSKKDELFMARQEVSEALKLDPRNLAARLALATVHLREDAFDLAIEQSNLVLNASPDHAQAAIVLGDAYLAKNEPEKSAAVVRGLAKVFPNDPQVLYRLGLLSMERGEMPEALAHFESALAANPNFLEPLERIVDIHLVQMKTDLARGRVELQIKRVPDHSGLHSLYASLLWKAGAINEAEVAYLKAIDLDNSNVQGYVSLGDLYRSIGRLEKGIEIYSAAIQKDPRLNSVRLRLAQVYEEKNDFEKAREFYDQILTRDPRHGAAANNLAYLIMRQGGNIDVALSYALIARAELPNDPYVADTIGWIYYQQQGFKRATSLLKEAAAKLSSNPVVQYHLGMALLKVGDKAEARKKLETALALDDKFPEAEKVRQALATI
jgi:tetratricopeptide (TPR) repeat protein